MESMRLDKFLSVTGTCSRAEAKKQIRAGTVCVNGKAARSADEKLCPQTDAVTVCGVSIVYRKFTYILLNKPQGVVSATEDGRDKTVLELLPDDVRRPGLFPCGRLDKNTLGLMLITDDGDLAHRLLAPKHHVEKEYFFEAARPLSHRDIARLETGVVLEDGYETKPAHIRTEGDGTCGTVTLVEGKYHQIKRMFEAVENKILFLERIRFGKLTLFGLPERGDWRYLTEEEIAELERSATQSRTDSR